MEETIQAVVNTLTWPAAFAIVGSVVAIVTGLFGYIISTRRNSSGTSPAEPRNDVQLLHDRISELKTITSQIKADCSVLEERVDSLDRITTNAQKRDQEDLRQINLKIEKMSDIIMKILTDEKL